MISRYWPDYIRNKDLEQVSGSENRKVWLKAMLIVIEGAKKEYTAEITDLANRAAKLDGKSDIASWLSAAGGITMAIPGVVTQIVGGVATLGGAVWNMFERNKDSKEAARLAEQVKSLLIEASIVEDYRLQYQREYNKLTWTPIIIVLVIIAILFLF